MSTFYQHKSWQDKRSGWDRRVRLYHKGRPIGYEGENLVRLKFDDEYGSVSHYYLTAEDAQIDYDLFREGRISTLDLMQGAKDSILDNARREKINQ